MKTMMVLAAGLAAASVWAHGDPAKGKEAAVVCQTCHMENGGGKDNGDIESWPRLAGLPAAYLEKQMQDFKSGSREAPTMIPFANLLTDEQLADVSAYYATLPPPASEAPPAGAARRAHGAKLAPRGDGDRYLPPCAACHGPGNQGAGDIFPALAGQHAGYLKKQLQLWQEDKRQNDINQLMLSIAKRLTPEDIDAVAHWLAAQPAQGEQP
ncbi:MAG: c-type cytochrome [Cardiobacteriaceae bacterium]|nr:c-type cytochrome [Cardiobacteriaceae bacterium]